MSDPVADMLTQIRNAQAVYHKVVKVPASMLKKAILSVLKEEGYIETFEEISDENNIKKKINITLKYFQNRPVIEKIKRISKPGLRIYKNSQEMAASSSGAGIAIVTTPKGVMTAKKAHANNMGGEILCTVE